MDFLGIGGGEILIILLVAVLIWGPGRIVEIARSLGKTVRAFRKATSELSNQVSRELEEQKKQLGQEKPGKIENPTVVK